jgi:hypothetical protein
MAGALLQMQGGWLRQAAAAAVSRPYHPNHQQNAAYDDRQWAPANPAAEQQQELHRLVYSQQQQAAQQPQRLASRPAHPNHQPYQQQQQLDKRRSSKANPRSWQWMASQLELSSSSLTVDQLLNYLFQLVQPGIGPSAADRHLAHYCSFITRLLALLQQPLEGAVEQYHQQYQQQQQYHQHPQQQQQQPAVSLNQVSKIIWSLGKLQLQPNWAILDQQQQQYQHAAPFSQQQLQRVALNQRSAAAVTAAARLMQLHMQIAQQQQQQQQQQQVEGGQYVTPPIPPKQLSQAVWGLVKLQYPASGEFLQLYLSATQQSMSLCSCR